MICPLDVYVVPVCICLCFIHLREYPQCKFVSCYFHCSRPEPVVTVFPLHHRRLDLLTGDVKWDPWWSCRHQVWQVGFSPGILVYSNTKTTRTRTSIPTNINCISYHHVCCHHCALNTILTIWTWNNLPS